MSVGLPGDLTDRHVSAVRREGRKSDRIGSSDIDSERANADTFFGIPEHDEPILAR